MKKLIALFMLAVLPACATQPADAETEVLAASAEEVVVDEVVVGEVVDLQIPDASEIDEERSGHLTDNKVMIFEVGPEMIDCEGAGPMKCLVINGEPFYDTINGFTHVPGETSTILVERYQWCDPSVLNGCPMDASIYRYKFMRVIDTL